MSNYNLKRKEIKGKDLFGKTTTHGIELILINGKKKTKVEISEKQSKIIVPFINQLISEIDMRDDMIEEIRSII